MKVLLTGISGGIGRLAAEQLLNQGHEVIGIDRRPWPDPPPGIRVFRADIRKRPAEDVLRTERPDAVVHLATVTHFSTRFEERYRINLQGTRRLLENCHRHGVKKVVFVGRHTVYGAAADSPLYETEEQPPLAVSTFPELADLVAADLYASSAIWRWPDMATSVLRLVYTLGPSRRGTLAAWLAAPKVATILGYDPLYQFMHERDAATAIIASLGVEIRGIFNVAGPPPIPLSLLFKLTGVKSVPLPEPAYLLANGRFGFRKMPEGVVNHLKYPIVINDSAFREADRKSVV